MDLTCNCCKEKKKPEAFHNNKKASSGKRNICKQCVSTKFKKGKKFKDENRDRQLKRRYGIDLIQYNELFISQNGSCAICNTHQSKLKVSLAVDHCHTTGKVRGLLCYNCNSGLGRFKDNTSYLLTAAEYLNR